MNKKINLIIVFFVMLLSILIVSCDNRETKTYTIRYMVDSDIYLQSEVLDYQYLVAPTNPVKEGYEFVGWYLDDELYDFESYQTVTSDLVLNAKFEIIPFVEFEISGKNTVLHNNSLKLNIKYAKDSTKVKVNWSVSDDTVVDFLSTGDSYCTIRAVFPGEAVIYASATLDDGTIYQVSHKIVVTGNDYEIKYNLDEEDIELLPADAITSYNSGNLPYQLPVLEKEYYVFVGWEIDGMDGIFTSITDDYFFDGDLSLTPKWIFPHLDLSFESNDVLIGTNEINKIIVNPFDIDETLLNHGFIWKSNNEKVATVDENGVVTGINDGYAEIMVSLKDNEKINASIGITVSSNLDQMNEILLYFANVADSSNIVKMITVTGWQFAYEHELRSSVIGYLFEDLEITENIAPINGYNRPGIVKPKYYITIHDTGDSEYTAKDWSDTVYNHYNEMTNQTYEASYQYVIDNKDVYHNIPDNEVSYHAGDGSREYELLSTGVFGTNLKPIITITTDGYYAIDGVKTKVVAPTNGGKILTTADINDCGIRCVIQNGEYYLGRTWWSSTYKKISNYGGNRNSIGIESCITKGDDIYYTWQRLAKLVAKLMDENNLTVNDIVPHHYFSGKHCPQTMREAGMWDHFLNLCQIEYDILQYVKAGYEISFKSNNPEYVNDSGRVIKTSSIAKTISYTITVSKDGVSSSITLATNIQNKPFNR